LLGAPSTIERVRGVQVVFTFLNQRALLLLIAWWGVSSYILLRASGFFKPGIVIAF